MSSKSKRRRSPLAGYDEQARLADSRLRADGRPVRRADVPQETRGCRSSIDWRGLGIFVCDFEG